MACNSGTVQHVIPDCFLNIKSFLSTDVYQMLCHYGISKDAVNILTSEGTLDWSLNEILLLQSDKDFKNTVLKLAPGLSYIQRKYQGMTVAEFQNTSKPFLEWTKNEKIFFHSFELLHDAAPESQLLACLLLTASLDRALGDVFLLKGKNIPYLLKDLLATTELTEILGSNMMRILNMFLGSPLYLNIRNILWHGFISPAEMDNRYGYFFIVLAMTIGIELKAQNILCYSIPHRSFITFEKLCDVKSVFSEIHDDDICKILLICLQSPVIFIHITTSWKFAIGKYEEKRYGECSALLIPLLENCLRVIFASANNCPDRILTAEASSRYVTFTEIFSEYLEDGTKNLFSTVITANELELLFDVFVHPEGPRLRDKLSHGELNFFDIPKYLVKHIFCVFAVICMKFIKEDVKVHGAYFYKLYSCMSQYQPLYHPSTFLKQKICKLISSLENWDSCPVYEPELISTDMYSENKHLYELCISSILEVFQVTLPNKWSSFSDGLMVFLEYMTKIRILVIYRPKLEGEITSILRKIASHALTISENIQHSLRDYHSSLENKLLRSRQRSTYFRLLKSIHIFYGCLRLVLVWLTCFASNLNKASHWSSDEINASIRFLKNVLKYCENISSMSEGKTNRYHEASLVCLSLLEKSEYYFKYLNKYD